MEINVAMLELLAGDESHGLLMCTRTCDYTCNSTTCQTTCTGQTCAETIE